MGIHVYLDILPHTIKPSAWAAAYDDALRVLRAYPDRLLGLNYRSFFGTKLKTYTYEIERHIHTPKERCWSVAGDLKSKRTAENPTMYRDLAHYRTQNSGDEDVDDILLWAQGDASRTTIVFHEKTQGQPFHFAILAAAMVVEARFPQYAMVWGEIDREQAERARIFAEQALNESIPLPVRVDATRLFERLQKHYKGKQLADAFDELLITEDYKHSETVLKILPNEGARSWWLRQLVKSKSIHSLRASELITSWLNVTHDLEQLCELVCFDPQGPHVEPEKLVEQLASLWLGFPKELTQPFELFNKPQGQPHSIASLMVNIPIDFIFSGRHLAYQLELEEIESIFTKIFGKESLRLMALFRKETKAKQKLIEPVRNEILKFVDSTNATPYVAIEDLASVSSIKELPEVRKQELSIVAFGIQTLQRKLEQDPELQGLVSQDIHPTQLAIAKLLERVGPTLTEDACEQIEREQDLKILRFLVTLVTMRRNELNFSQIRRAIFENEKVRRFVFEATTNEACMMQIQEQMKKAVNSKRKQA